MNICSSDNINRTTDQRETKHPELVSSASRRKKLDLSRSEANCKSAKHTQADFGGCSTDEGMERIEETMLAHFISAKKKMKENKISTNPRKRVSVGTKHPTTRLSQPDASDGLEGRQGHYSKEMTTKLGDLVAPKTARTNRAGRPRSRKTPEVDSVSFDASESTVRTENRSRHCRQGHYSLELGDGDTESETEDGSCSLEDGNASILGKGDRASHHNPESAHDKQEVLDVWFL